MKRILGMVSLITILIAVVATASTRCPCSRPGASGIIVGFVAREGTTDNVNLYTEVFPPEKGVKLDVWATKEIDEAIVPIENLTIRIEIDSAVVEELVTDDNGYFNITPAEPGSYAVYGGDAKMLFDIAVDEPEPVACTLDAKICPDGSYVGRVSPDCEFEECPVEEPPKEPEPGTYTPPPQNTGISGSPKGDGFDWTLPIAAIIIVIIVVAIIILKKRKKKHRLY